MPEKLASAEFRLFGKNRRWNSILLSIMSVDFAPPNPRIVDLVVKVPKGRQVITYLDESRTRGKPDVTSPGGKFLGPILRRNVNFTDAKPVIEGSEEGRISKLYPLSDNYEVYGVWGLLDIINGEA